jgi:hypothetical protein
MSQGLNLGDSAGTLPDGSRLTHLTGDGTAASPNQVRWLKNGLIITVAGNLALDGLDALAEQVSLSSSH